MTAGVEGTEFVVAVEPAAERADIGVIDGRVSVTNAQGSLLLGPGESAAASLGRPPRRIDVRPRDAVRWAIFYPPALWQLPDERGGPPLDASIAEAWRAWRSGGAARSAVELKDLEKATLDPASLSFAAALLLSVGRIDEAAVALDAAEARGPPGAFIPSLRTVIAVARNDVDGALRQSAAALALDPGNSAALIARSYALQAAFRLDEGRDIVVDAAKDDPLAAARLAELELALGNIREARRAAEKAIDAAPALSRPRAILGFAALGSWDLKEARRAFEDAARLDPGDPLPRIGLGLAAIRDGDLGAGRRQLEIAAILDPESSLARSYLGRAYAEEKRFDEAADEWRLAKEADPRDPTPHLYESLALRSLARPIEALQALETSIALNDNRAVYRSRVLLDQDLATRSAGLAAIYRDLGFEQKALNEGFKSVSVAPSNPGVHRFLADTYMALPRHETASDSELLQSLLLQPLNVAPLRPRLSREGLGILDQRGIGRIGYNEFSPLFQGDGVHFLLDGFGGSQDTLGGSAVANGLWRNWSFSLGQSYFRTDGVRDNNALRRRVTELLVQPALSERASLLAQYRFSDLDAGDTLLLFDPENFLPGGRRVEQRRQYRLGGRFDATSNVTLVGVWTREDLDSLIDTGLDFSVAGPTTGDLGEAAAYVTHERYNVVAGGGYFDGRDRAFVSFGPDFALPEARTDTRHRNAWVYGTLRPLHDLRLTLGASYDDFLRSDFSRDQFNPKIGASWDVVPDTTVRAAYFRSLKRSLVGGQTIEPTQVAGFNQLFDDVNGTDAWRWGVGIDHRLTSRVAVGAEYSQRRLDVPAINAADGSVFFTGWREKFFRAYASWIPTDRIAVNAEIDWERLVRDPLARNADLLAELTMFRIPIEARYFDPSGVFGLVRVSFVREDGQFAAPDGSVGPGEDRFATVDVGVGWRLPGRAAIAVLEVRNLFDAGFRFQDTDPTNPRITPDRKVLARITLGF